MRCAIYIRAHHTTGCALIYIFGDVPELFPVCFPVCYWAKKFIIKQTRQHHAFLVCLVVFAGVGRLLCVYLRPAHCAGLLSSSISDLFYDGIPFFFYFSSAVVSHCVGRSSFQKFCLFFLPSWTSPPTIFVGRFLVTHFPDQKKRNLFGFV